MVDGYGDGAALVHRIHHCIADGIALSRVLLSLADDSDDPDARPIEAPPKERARGNGKNPLQALAGSARGIASAAIGAAGSVAHESLEVAKHPSHMLDLANAGREDADALAKVLLRGNDPKTALKGEMGIAKGVAWSDPIPLVDVVDMGHATGNTVNDIVMTAVAGAFRAYLDRHGEFAEQLTAMVPFNLRSPTEPLPSTLGNKFGLVFLGLPVGTASRRIRLRKVHESMKQIKQSHEGVVAYGVLDAMGRTPEGLEQTGDRPVHRQRHRGRDQCAGSAQAGLPGRNADRRGAGLGAVFRGRFDDHFDLQLQRRADGGPDGRRGPDPESG